MAGTQTRTRELRAVDLPGPGLWTTSVGSFPKPDYVRRARSQVARGEIERAELVELERRATKE
jgi:5-methyltetrahydropteroyltriglutamate--homocysteine methyltransferase